MELLNLLKTTIDLVYPRQCQFCEETRGCDQFAFLCDRCFLAAIRLEQPCCQKCGLPFFGEISSEFECPNCSQMKLHFDRAVSLMRFRGVVRHAIHGFKYSRQFFWSKVLGRWMEEGMDAVIDSSELDLIVPVPLHPVRERERGFNQATVLSKQISARKNLPVEVRGLRRLRMTETQTHLDREERQNNLRGAFGVTRPEFVEGKRVLLVDDVLTTGSTASECARVLSEAGATSVLVFTLARG